MLKVNEQAILDDYSKLKEKKALNESQIEKDAKAYAELHYFDEAQTADFVAFVKKLQNNGLSKTDSNLLEFFNLYVDEVEDTPTEVSTPITEFPEAINY